MTHLEEPSNWDNLGCSPRIETQLWRQHVFSAQFREYLRNYGRKRKNKNRIVSLYLCCVTAGSQIHSNSEICTFQFDEIPFHTMWNVDFMQDLMYNVISTAANVTDGRRWDNSILYNICFLIGFIYGVFLIRSPLECQDDELLWDKQSFWSRSGKRSKVPARAKCVDSYYQLGDVLKVTAGLLPKYIQPSAFLMNKKVVIQCVGWG